jgi:hypothetical protein
MKRSSPRISRFLFREEIWQEIQKRIPGARHVSAAVAYLGGGAASLMSLRPADRLLVDVSPNAVRTASPTPTKCYKS